MRRSRHVAIAVLLLASSVPAFAAEPATKPADVVHVRGRVLRPDGSPAAGASVTVPGPTPDGWGSFNEVAIVARATAGPDGRFAVDLPAADAGGEGRSRRQLLAIADGLGVAWATYDDVDAAGDVVLTLAEDRPVAGRIVDADGKPAAGVEVVVNSVATATKEAEFVEAMKTNPRAPERMIRWLPLASAGRAAGATTDADGRFTLAGLGKDRSAQLQYRGATVGYGTFTVRNRPGESEIELTPQPVGWSTKRVIYGSTFEHKAVPAQSIEGVVRDAATGDPVAGVVVQSMHFSDPEHTVTFSPQGVIRSTTDATGRYRLEGFPRGKGNVAIVLPPLDGEVAYFTRDLALPDDGKDATIDVELHRGVWIEGRVADKATGTPVPARVFYTTYLDNPFAGTVPEFKRDGKANLIEGIYLQSRYATRPDGNYRVVGLPGPGLVWIWTTEKGFRNGVGWDGIAALKDYRTMADQLFQPTPPNREMTPVVREVMVPQDVASERADLLLERGESIRVTVVDADGKPAAGPFQVRGDVPDRTMGWNARELVGPMFESRAWSPEETRVVWVIDDANGRGVALPVRFADVKAGVATATLQPLMMLTGRVLDADGKPIAGVDLEASDQDHPGGRTLRMFKTDADGRFKTTLAAGVAYYVQVWTGPHVGDLVAKDVKVEPGGTKDVGDVRMRRPRRRRSRSSVSRERSEREKAVTPFAANRRADVTWRE